MTRSSASTAAGVAVGRGVISVAIVDDAGVIVATDTARCDNKADGDAVAAIAAPLVKTLATGPLAGVGVAVPGLCDPESGTVTGSVGAPSLVGTALTRSLEKALGGPVVVDSDGRALALAEQWLGQGRDVDDFASVQTGDSLGAGIVLRGVLHRGAGGQAGELGHTTVDFNGDRCRCGLRGCWETVATTRWLRQQATARGIRNARTVDVARLTDDMGTDSLELLGDYADRIALGLANLVHLFGPLRLVLHGDAVSGGEAFRGLVEDATRRRCLATVRSQVDVVASELGDRAAVLGAAALVLRPRSVIAG